jgi:pimeloyl-ACP methyl ester carboxylesterase/DNA-binding SARP family transcriptional activator
MIEITLLGDFAVTRDGERVPDDRWTRRQAASLVKFLALAPERRAHREQVLDALWPDQLVGEAGPKLHKAAHFVRRAVDDRTAVVLRGDTVLLWPDDEVVVDAADFTARAEQALRGGGAAALTSALARCGGDLLPGDPYEAWLDGSRVHVRRLRADVLRRLGRWDDLIAIDPSDEEAHLAIVRAHLDAGRPHDALRQWDRLEAALRDGLGVAPGPGARALRDEAAAAASAGALPRHDHDLVQEIQFCRTPDGVRLAYATVGTGPPLVKVANWLTHLEYDWESIVWRHWLRALAQDHTLIRYDERGCGLSDGDDTEPSVDVWVRDLEAIVDTLGLERFPLFGVSQGAAVAVTYAARHPERVSRLVIYGGYVLGTLLRAKDEPARRAAELLPQLAELGWGSDDVAFRQVFTARFMPDGTPEQWRAFNELQRRTTTPTAAARFLRAFHRIDVSAVAPLVQAPTLILHARDDRHPPLDQGRQLAALIPNSRFVSLDSSNHILLEHEPAWARFRAEVARFLGPDPDAAQVAHG